MSPTEHQENDEATTDKEQQPAQKSNTYDFHHPLEETTENFKPGNDEEGNPNKQHLQIDDSEEHI
jgi:hypothetical protein